MFTSDGKVWSLQQVPVPRASRVQGRWVWLEKGKEDDGGREDVASGDRLKTRTACDPPQTLSSTSYSQIGELHNMLSWLSLCV